jgi:hypothetical protein
MLTGPSGIAAIGGAVLVLVGFGAWIFLARRRRLAQPDGPGDD